MSSVQGKVIAITGGASRIGFETAKLLSSRGAKVSIADVQQDLLTEAGAEIKSIGGEVFTFKLDVRDREQVESWVKQTVSHFGKLDGAANVARVMGKDIAIKGADEISDEDWEFVLGVNLTSLMYCQRAELQSMKDGGAIVNVASRGGIEGAAKTSAYSASKNGVIGLTRCAAKEMGARGIRVNAVAPGPTETPMFNNTMAANASNGTPITRGSALKNIDIHS
ncbi:NAD(P)-binding protein [Periconia macrospinosa]|uniref:NAD(P)-binding protein n=1 Tax=Periconia macrospinosa TaxID=97972 RepID=A0A2V1D329_9PLEO|nr:NAD(P)-binding protein [Periconia macrospinosa]